MRPRVLVSGGSGGIGSALCPALDAAGYRPIIAFAHSHAHARALAARCQGEAVPLDLTEPAAIDRALGTLKEAEEPLAAVVLAATAPLRLETFGRLTADDLDQQWRVHVQGPRQLLAGLLRQSFRPRRRGTVVGILSQAMGTPDESATPLLGSYIVAKHALAGLLAALAADHPWLDVRTVRPGFTDTGLLEAFDPRFLEQLRQRTPFSAPEEVAREIVAQLPDPKTLVP